MVWKDFPHALFCTFSISKEKGWKFYPILLQNSVGTFYIIQLSLPAPCLILRNQIEFLPFQIWLFNILSQYFKLTIMQIGVVTWSLRWCCLLGNEGCNSSKINLRWKLSQPQLNLNTTSTQLNWVGIDSKMELHTHFHPSKTQLLSQGASDQTFDVA